MIKNTSGQKLYVYVWDATTGLGKTGDASNLTAYVDKDYAGFNALGDTSATEVDSTNKKGLYQFDLTQGETNADTLTFFVKSSTSNITGIAWPPTLQTVAPNFSAAAISSAGGVTLADGVSHGGTLGSSTATLALSRINVTSQTSNTTAFTIAGNGTGKGIDCAGGATGRGAMFSGGATSGEGVFIQTQAGATDALYVAASGTGSGAVFIGGNASGSTAGGHGIKSTGGTASTSSGGTSGHGVKLVGGAGAASTNGAADGLYATGGGTTTVSGGNGVSFVHTGSVYDLNATSTPLTLAKTTNITGFNDIAASSVVSGGAITVSSGAVTLTSAYDAAKTAAQAGDVMKISSGTGANQLSLSSGAVIVQSGTGTGQISLSSGTVTVGTNNDKTGYRLSATGVDDVWDEVQSGHTTSGTFGKYLDAAVSGVSTGGVSAADIATAVWTDLLSGSDFSTVASIGKLLKDDIDATISSRGTSTLTQTQVTGGAYALNSSSFAWNSGLDFSTTQKSSIGTAVAASAVASVTGNVGGNVTGSVGSIATGGITTASFASGATIPRCTLVDTTTTNTDMLTAAAVTTSVLTTQMTQSYRSLHAAPTLAQAQFEIIAHLGSSSISSTTKTTKKIDGSTTAKTYTLDSASTPTSITEAS